MRAKTSQLENFHLSATGNRKHEEKKDFPTKHLQILKRVKLKRFSLVSGQLTCKDSQWEMNPKLWVALSGGRIVVFDAASWSLLQDCIQVGESQVVRMHFTVLVFQGSKVTLN